MPVVKNNETGWQGGVTDQMWKYMKKEKTANGDPAFTLVEPPKPAPPKRAPRKSTAKKASSDT